MSTKTAKDLAVRKTAPVRLPSGEGWTEIEITTLTAKETRRIKEYKPAPGIPMEVLNSRSGDMEPNPGQQVYIRDCEKREHQVRTLEVCAAMRLSAGGKDYSPGLDEKDFRAWAEAMLKEAEEDLLEGTITQVWVRLQQLHAIQTKEAVEKAGNSGGGAAGAPSTGS